MENLIGCVSMAVITLPLSFLIARGFLRGIIRIMGARRDVL